MPARWARRRATSTWWSSVREDERFVREGDDLVTALDVAAPLAALGGDTRDPDARGHGVGRVAVRNAARRGAHAAGEGMPALKRGRHGDLRVVVNVVVPRRLSAEQRELMERLNESLTGENLRSQESMFAKLRRALGSQAA